MPLSIDSSQPAAMNPRALALLLARHESHTVPRLHRLWAYYRNEATLRRAGRAVSAQAVGLPHRLRGAGNPASDDRAPEREVVIENDIAWRVDAMVDFVFGKPIRLVSTSPDPQTRAVVEAALDACWEQAGGTMLLQDMALLGAVHGTVDLVVRADALVDQSAAGSLAGAFSEAGDESSMLSAARAAGRAVGIEVVDAARGVPISSELDYQQLDGYCVWSRAGGGVDAQGSAAQKSLASRVWSAVRGAAHGSGIGQDAFVADGLGGADPGSRAYDVVELFGPLTRELHVGGARVDAGPHGLDVVPVVRIANRPMPMQSEGLSEVEPLTPLQDELNTRLSDRAHRVTMQSFRMYLAKGIDGFGSTAVGPGQIWSTDNPDAEVEAFGGDVYTPSETEHIQQVRDAMDKLSGVSPLVLGLLRARIGHLSSENALRITLMGVLSKAERKRLTYGRGIARASGLVLRALSNAGVMSLTEADMGVRIAWPDPLPVDESRSLQAAKLKLELGVPQARVLDELGYAPTDEGVV